MVALPPGDGFFEEVLNLAVARSGLISRIDLDLRDQRTRKSDGESDFRRVALGGSFSFHALKKPLKPIKDNNFY